MRFGLVPAALILGFGLLFSVALAGRIVLQTKASNRSIRVKGYAARQITSDFVVWTAQVTARAAVLRGAYEALEADVAKVAGLAQVRGVPASQISRSAVTTDVRYRRNDRNVETSEIEAYVLQQSLTVRIADVRLVAALAEESNALIKEGLEFRSLEPEYYYSALEALKIEMLGEATRNARQRAERIAQSGGMHIGRLVSAQQGVFQITPVHSTATSDYGMLDTRSIEKTVKAVVDAEFSVR
jgi:hypothetical protein